MWIPVMLKSEHVRPVIFGGGHSACMKAETLCRYGVQSVMVCPEPPAWISDMEPTPIWIKGTYEAGFMDGATLVIAATSDDELNGRICEEAASIPLPALNVSHGELGSLRFVKAGTVQDITVTLSTDGASPTASGMMLAELMEALREGQWPERVRLLGEIREILKKSEPDAATRQETMRELSLVSLEELIRRRLDYED